MTRKDVVDEALKHLNRGLAAEGHGVKVALDTLERMGIAPWEQELPWHSVESDGLPDEDIYDCLLWTAEHDGPYRGSFEAVRKYDDDTIEPFFEIPWLDERDYGEYTVIHWLAITPPRALEPPVNT